MPDFVYPDSIYDQPRNLLSVLGSFWTEIYHASDQMLSYSTAKAQVETQSMLDLLGLIAAMSRYDVPIYHKDNWFLLTLRKSERNDAQTSLLKYGGGNYDDGHQYDVPPASPFSAFPRPSLLADAKLVMNRFTDPSLMLTQGIDFVLDGNAIVFLNNPFEDARVAKRPVYQDGHVVDEEAALWIFRGDFDWDTIYRQFGYVLGLRLQSSRGYRDLMNAVFDAIVGGGGGYQVALAFSAMTGIPLVHESEETVETISMDNDHRLIITDQHVYKFDPMVTVTVAEGDTVRRGDSLVDALQIIEFNRGITPNDLRGLAMGRGLLSSCYYADLIFENKDVPLAVHTNDPSGFTKLTFELGGFPADVARFFDDLHERGVERSLSGIDTCNGDELVLFRPGDGCDTSDVYVRKQTLAHLLDRRETVVGEPTAAHLPTHINPLQFLVENVLRNNAFVVRVKASHLGRSGVGLYNARILHKVIPPHTAMILLVELTAAKDSVTTDGYVREAISTFTGMEPLRDDVPSDFVREKTTIKVVSGTCQ